jgi:purine-binding chemotaxis protein CheW
MSTSLTTTQSNSSTLAHVHTNELLTVYLDDQIFGIPILQVQDVLGTQNMTRIPLAPPEIAGSLNLRGRIVTGIWVRERLGLSPMGEGHKSMSIVVEHEHELYSLIFDRVGEVMNLPITDYEGNPSTLEPKFREVADGIYRLADKLLVVLDVPKMLNGIGAPAATAA